MRGGLGLWRGARWIIGAVGGGVVLVFAAVFAAAFGDFRNQRCMEFGMRAGNCSDAVGVMKISGMIVGLVLLALGAILVLNRRVHA